MPPALIPDRGPHVLLDRKENVIALKFRMPSSCQAVLLLNYGGKQKF
jgi:hypothetical protein